MGTLEGLISWFWQRTFGREVQRLPTFTTTAWVYFKYQTELNIIFGTVLICSALNTIFQSLRCISLGANMSVGGSVCWNMAISVNTPFREQLDNKLCSFTLADNSGAPKKVGWSDSGRGIRSGCHPGWQMIIVPLCSSNRPHRHGRPWSSPANTEPA